MRDSTTKARAGEVDEDVSAGEVVLFVAGADAPLIKAKVVSAICRRVEQAVEYRKWKREEEKHGRYRSRFIFEIVDPPEYQGVMLEMFVRCEPEWRDRSLPPLRSKLYQIACIALGRPMQKKDRITNRLWVGRVFRCTIAQGTGPSGIPVIKDIIAVETGGL